MLTFDFVPRRSLVTGRLALAGLACLLLGSACASGAPPTPPTTPEPDQPTPATASSAPPAAASELPTEPTEAPEDERYQNTIKWSTASELDNFGYDVFRGLDEEGPFERINPEVIEGAGTTDEPSYYRFVDDVIDPHQTYFYYVESISMSGVRERFTPVAKVGPKIPTDDSSRDPDGG